MTRAGYEDKKHKNGRDSNNMVKHFEMLQRTLKRRPDVPKRVLEDAVLVALQVHVHVERLHVHVVALRGHLRGGSRRVVDP